jgi:hypothetical protein
MGQMHHGYVTTKAAVGRAIQHSSDSRRVLTQRLSIDPKTVARRKARGWVEDREPDRKTRG